MNVTNAENNPVSENGQTVTVMKGTTNIIQARTKFREVLTSVMVSALESMISEKVNPKRIRKLEKKLRSNTRKLMYNDNHYDIVDVYRASPYLEQHIADARRRSFDFDRLRRDYILVPISSDESFIDIPVKKVVFV